MMRITYIHIIARTALHLTAINFKSQGKFYEVKPVYSHLIASLSVFTEWCSANTHYLMYQPPSEALTPKNYSVSSGGPVQSMVDTDLGYSSSEGQWGRARSSDNGFSPTLGRSRGADGGKGHGGGMGMVPVDWEVLYLADSDTLRNEVRAKSGMRAAVSDLRSTIVLDIDSNRHASDAKTNPTTLVRGYLPMSEDIMLRGFLPVADYIEQVHVVIWSDVEILVMVELPDMRIIDCSLMFVITEMLRRFQSYCQAIQFHEALHCIGALPSVENSASFH